MNNNNEINFKKIKDNKNNNNKLSEETKRDIKAKITNFKISYNDLIDLTK